MYLQLKEVEKPEEDTKSEDSMNEAQNKAAKLRAIQEDINNKVRIIEEMSTGQAKLEMKRLMLAIKNKIPYYLPDDRKDGKLPEKVKKQTPDAKKQINVKRDVTEQEFKEYLRYFLMPISRKNRATQNDFGHIDIQDVKRIPQKRDKEMNLKRKLREARIKKNVMAGIMKFKKAEGQVFL